MKVLTTENLRKRCIAGSSRCAMYLQEESAKHLFFECSISCQVWDTFYLKLGWTFMILSNWKDIFMYQNAITLDICKTKKPLDEYGLHLQINYVGIYGIPITEQSLSKFSFPHSNCGLDKTSMEDFFLINGLRVWNKNRSLHVRKCPFMT